MIDDKNLKKENLNDGSIDPEKKQVKNPVFNVHRMPKGYKSGRFENIIKKNDSVDNFSGSVLGEKNQQEKKHQGKKIGFLIVFFGVIIVAFLAYAVFSYIKNPQNFSLKMPSFSFLSNIGKTDNDIVNQEPKNDNNVSGEDIIDEQSSEQNEIDELPFIDETDVASSSDIVDINTPDENNTTTEENIDQDDVVMFDSFSDTDGDGLNDDEESLLGTNNISVDSDSDGYDDLTELTNLYNPAGQGSISINSNIDKYSNGSFSYDIFYPKKFEIKALSDGTSVIFLIDDNSFIQVLVEKNEDKKNIESWYFSRFFEVADSLSVIEKEGWSGVYSPDFYSFYLTDDKKENVYSIVYSFPENKMASYYNIFRMMINSFKLK